MGAPTSEAREQALWCLERFDLLQELSEAEKAALRDRIRIHRYEKGETVYLPGDPGNTIYFLTRGQVKLSHLDESGKRLTLRICTRGEPFGETALTGQDRHTLAAIALEDTELCAIDREELIHLAQANPRLSLRITKFVGRYLAEIENRLDDLIFKDITTRLARLLHRLAAQHGRATDSGTRIELALTHQDLADLIGSTRETTSATLSGLEGAGIIRKDGRRLVIVDAEALQREARLL